MSGLDALLFIKARGSLAPPKPPTVDASKLLFVWINNADSACNLM